jgi:hypothetical protein
MLDYKNRLRAMPRIAELRLRVMRYCAELRRRAMPTHTHKYLGEIETKFENISGVIISGP